MAIAYASSAGTSIGGIDGNNIVVNKPSGTASGDLLVALGYTGSGTVSAPAGGGWTTASDQTSIRLFWKLAGGAEPSSYTFTRSAGVTTSLVAIARITGAHATTPIDTASAVAVAAGTSIVIPSLTATTGTYLFQMTSSGTGGITFTPPGGTSEDYDGALTTSNLTSAAGHQTISTGATGSRTWTASSSASVGGGMFAIAAPSTGNPGAGFLAIL